MSKKFSSEYFFVRQLIQLANEHRANCKKEYCEINFAFLLEVLKQYAMPFSASETKQLLGNMKVKESEQRNS
jgi:hypothetical protein